MTTTTPPIIEQTHGFQFDPNDFAMTFASSGTVFAQHQTTSIEEWENEEASKDEEEEKIIEVEKDPDLEDGDEAEDNYNDDDETDELGDVDDDEFEQYLFGEDDE